MVNLLIGKALPMRRNRSPFQDLCDCTHCTLAVDGQAEQPVAGAGNPDARLIFVGEAPGATEVVVGQPFVGESGRLLNQVLEEELGIRREDVYCTNALLCQPPKNRTPNKNEVLACNQRLRQELLSLSNRHIIVVLGTSAVKAVTNRSEGITSSLFKVEWSPEYHCFITYAYHPAACLYSADNYQDMLFCMQRARDYLDRPKSPIASPQVRYDLEDSAMQACTRLDKLYTHVKDFISCDIETSKVGSLDYRVGTLSQLGFGFNWYGEDRAYLLPSSILGDFWVQNAVKRLFARRDICWVWHNGKFDVQFLSAMGIKECIIHRDTQLMNKSLDERSGKHRLGMLAAKYYGDFDYKSSKDEELGFTTPEYHAKDCVYTLRLGRDTLPAQFAREKPSPHGYPDPMFRHNTILAPVWNDLAEIELYGIETDKQYALDLAQRMGGYVEPRAGESRPEEVELGGELGEIERTCQRLAAHSFSKQKKRKEHIDRPPEYYQKDIPAKGIKKGDVKPSKPRTVYVPYSDEQALNLNSPPQLGRLLYDVWGLPVLKSTEKGQPSVDEETLVLLNDIVTEEKHRAFLATLLQFREKFKLYSTYVLGAIREAGTPGHPNFDGKIHPQFGFIPVTGRPSAKRPNIQNIPKVSPIKGIYIARPGYWFVQADYGQQEMRVAAWYSRDRELLKACLEGDFHSNVAKAVFRKQYEEIDACGNDIKALERLLAHYAGYRAIASEYARTPCSAEALAGKMRKHWRFTTKGINFGALYGQTPSGLQDYLLRVAKIEVSLNESASYHRSWFNLYHDLTRWMAEQRHLITTLGFVDTPMGHRRRKFLITPETRKEAENQAMNSPVQSLASDMTMLAVIELHKQLKERDLGHILFFVHDSIAFEIRQDRLDEGTALIRDVMEHALDPIQHDDFYVPFSVEIEYGRGWGELQPLEAA